MWFFSGKISKEASSSNNSKPFMRVTCLACLVLACTVTSILTAMVLTKGAYSRIPATDWVLVGALHATQASARIRTSTVDGIFVVLAASDLLESDKQNAVLADSHNGVVFRQALDPTLVDQVQAVTIDGLTSNTAYHYGVVHPASGEVSMQGTFRTTVPAGQRFNFTVAAAGCAWTGSTHAVFDEIRREDPLMFLHLGDFHYEDIGSNDLEERLDAIGTTLGSSAQAELYRSTGLVAMWDDHDYLGIGGSSGYAEPELGARETALESYRSAFPHYELAAPNEAPYHAFTVGTVRFVVTDLRSEASGDNMYSDAQRTWFLAELAQAAEYDFVVWLSTKPWIGELIPDEDYWVGYENERHDLSEYISKALGETQNLLAVAADAHMVAFDDGTNTYYGSSEEPMPSFPILQTGPLDRMGNTKGGPFTEGCYATDLQRNHQYSTLSFEMPVDEDAEACIQIISYRVDTSKSEIFSKKLCGKFFKPSTKDVRVGTCEIRRFSTESNAWLGLSIALTLTASVVAAVYFGCVQCLVITLVLWFGYAGSWIGGAAVPLIEGLADLNMLPTHILLFIQSVLVLAYFWGCTFYSKRCNKNPIIDSKDHTDDIPTKEAKIEEPGSGRTMHAFDSKGSWLSDDEDILEEEDGDV
eukprot:scaffold1225_cov164-Amphora_coffeaeformis.AAC.25